MSYSDPVPPTRRTPPWTILFLLFIIAGAVAMVLPWFRPTIGSQHSDATVHSWNGVIFYAAPVLMALTAVSALRSQGDPRALRRAGVQGLISGVLLAVSAVVGWARVPSNFADWDEASAYAREHGLTLGRGPLIGFWLTCVVAVLLVALGVCTLIMIRKKPIVPAVYPPAFPSQG